MSKKKKAKKAAPVVADVACPKCGHPASKHVGRSYGLWAIYMGETRPAKGYCNENIATRAEDGFDRLKPCTCDLREAEVRYNVDARPAPKSVEAVLNSLLKS